MIDSAPIEFSAFRPASQKYNGEVKRASRDVHGSDRIGSRIGSDFGRIGSDRIGSDRIGSDRTLVGSDKNYRLSENPTIRSEVSNSMLNNIHIADMLLTDKM